MHPHRALVGLVVTGLLASGALGDDQTVTIFNAAPIQRVADAPDSVAGEGYTALRKGQVVETRVVLPVAPENQRDARRIVAIVEIQPVVVTDADQPRIADPWTRLGSIMVMMPGSDPAAPQPVEMLRFITPFGGACTFERDVTSYAPILSGETVFRAEISTWFSPAWTVTMRLEYRTVGAGYRRPKFVLPAMTQARFTAESAKQSFTVTIPESGLAMPRLHIVTSGHGGSQEFLAAEHVLRIDDREVARWRPWREDGGTLHEINPTSSRLPIDGRELWSCDIDRAGWLPGMAVEPLRLPAPELTPGEHRIEIEVIGILAEPNVAVQSYWLISATVVADEPWPAVEGQRP